MKKLLKVLPVMLVLALVLTNVFALDDEYKNVLSNGNASGTVSDLTRNIWSTVKVVAYVLAVGTIVFAGLKYMFASADQKADIKKSIGILIIGAIFVFGATLIIDIVSNVTNDVTDDVVYNNGEYITEEVA